METLLKTILAIGAIVMFSEYLWRKNYLRGEASRKLVHILTGTFVAFWAFYMDDGQILTLSALLFLIVLASRFFGFFHSIHKVSRKTWGELFFPLGIASAALLTDSPWIFMAAMLHVGIADGLAALLGIRYIRKHGYKVFKQQKTIVGTLTFFNASIFITLATMLLASDLQVNLVVVLLVPLMTTAVENLGQYGTDDLLVPLTVTMLLSSLSM
jgi:dolichol kinase